jgi:hypothetical protein
MAALALRDLGPKAEPALSALARALNDTEVGVRMTAADAIARQGPAAMSVFDALLAAAKAPQHVHVQRSLCAAFGAIGPRATAAIPVLIELAKVPRVGPAATTAMRRIRQ